MARIVTFTPNPALDLATSVDRLEDAHKLRCAEPLVHPGGGGVNVARVLHRLGADVLAVYPAGGGAGERLHRLLREEGVPGLRIPIGAETRENLTVRERASGREFRFVLPGPSLSAAEWKDGIDCLRQLSPAPQWLVASGGLPPGMPPEAYAELVRVAKGLGARVVVDCSGPALAAALAEGVDLVKPSLRELSEQAGRALATLEDRQAAARQWIDRGQARLVALSLGEEGAMLVTRDRCLLAQVGEVPVAGSVGAGDSFLAGLVWALGEGADLAAALASAVAAGAAAVMAPGTAMGQPQDQRSLKERVRVRDCQNPA